MRMSLNCRQIAANWKYDTCEAGSISYFESGVCDGPLGKRNTYEGKVNSDFEPTDVEGKVTWESGAKLLGVLENGVLRSGTLELPNGDVYKGSFTEGSKSDTQGVYTFQDGHELQGLFKDDFAVIGTLKSEEGLCHAFGR